MTVCFDQSFHKCHKLADVILMSQHKVVTTYSNYSLRNLRLTLLQFRRVNDSLGPSAWRLGFLAKKFLGFLTFLAKILANILRKVRKIFQDRGRESKKILAVLGNKSKDNQDLGKRNKKSLHQSNTRSINIV